MTEVEGTLTAISTAVSRWSPSPRQVLSSSAALTALGDLSPGGSLMKTSGGQKGSVKVKGSVPEAVVRELVHVQMELSELLRHLWHCFPVTSGELEKKLENSKSSLENFRYRRFVPFQENLKQNYQNSELTMHMAEMIDAALTKYHTWRKKRHMGFSSNPPPPPQDVSGLDL